MTAQLTPSEAMALPCYGQPLKWADSDSNKDREWAASQCFKRCAQLDWCEQQRQETVELHGSAVGVWAGHVWTHADYLKGGEGHVA